MSAAWEFYLFVRLFCCYFLGGARCSEKKYNNMPKSQTNIRSKICSLSFFPLIPAVTTASAAPVYHGGMISCLGDVEPVNTRWLIKGYFPMGAVSVVAGPGGVGKGVFMADVVAAVTTGRPTMLFPDAAVAQGNVLVLTSEDDPGMSLAPRMIAAEADMRRVFYATPGWYWQQKKKKLVIGSSLFELIDKKAGTGIILV